MSFFLAPTAIREAISHYEDGVDGLIEKLDSSKQGHNETDIRKLYKEVEQFIIRPWERIVQRRPPRKPLCLNKKI